MPIYRINVLFAWKTASMLYYTNAVICVRAIIVQWDYILVRIIRSVRFVEPKLRTLYEHICLNLNFSRTFSTVKISYACITFDLLNVFVLSYRPIIYLFINHYPESLTNYFKVQFSMEITCNEFFVWSSNVLIRWTWWNEKKKKGTTVVVEFFYDFVKAFSFTLIRSNE